MSVLIKEMIPFRYGDYMSMIKFIRKKKSNHRNVGDFYEKADNNYEPWL